MEVIYTGNGDPGTKYNAHLGLFIEMAAYWTHNYIIKYKCDCAYLFKAIIFYISPNRLSPSFLSWKKSQGQVV